MVDYTAHASLEAHLATLFGASPLDLIVDCVGNQTLFAASPDYLKTDGRFLSIVGGWSQGVVPYLRNNVLPTALGGARRSFKILGLAPSGVYVDVVKKWVQDGWVKEMPVDSEWPMEEAVEVRRWVWGGVVVD